MSAYRVLQEVKNIGTQNEDVTLQDILLSNRNIITKEERVAFLNPDFEKGIHDPLSMKGMEKAALRILQAISKNEKIVLYTDYDCDGIPAGVILHDFFKALSYTSFSNYIPHRHKEGYGLHLAAIDEFASSGTTLLITADVGITNMKEVAYAKEKGIDVILTDHHLPHEESEGDSVAQILPDAYALINNKQQGETYPFPLLCGAAVAWKLVCATIALAKRMRKEGEKDPHLLLFDALYPGWEKWLLDMVGLSTIADMVPLVGENRILATFGLTVLRKSRRPGLQALFSKMRLKQNLLSEDDISFMLAPRINAASRMDHPFDAFRLLATDSEEEADRLASYLHTLNDNRKTDVARIMKDVHKELKGRELPPVIVIGNPSWSPGVLGLLAGKVLEAYERPTFVWGRGAEETNIKGSCRSDGSVNVVDLMLAVQPEVFVNVGGHEFSGGFSLTYEMIHKLERELLLAYEKVRRENFAPTKKVFIDCGLPLSQVSLKQYKQIESLAPFGVGNQKPTFLFERVFIETISLFGKDKNHLQLMIKDGDSETVKAIGFFMNEKSFEEKVGLLAKGATISLVGQFEKSVFGRTSELRLRIIDVL